VHVKVSDFGLYHFNHHRKELLSQLDNSPGVLCWFAPEVLNNQPYTAKSDIYSFGLVLWLLITKQIPYSDCLTVRDLKQTVCVDEKRPEISVNYSSLKELIDDCLHPIPTQRPPFKSIIKRLDLVSIDVAINHDKQANIFWKKEFQR